MIPEQTLACGHLAFHRRGPFGCFVGVDFEEADLAGIGACFAERELSQKASETRLDQGFVVGNPV